MSDAPPGFIAPANPAAQLASHRPGIEQAIARFLAGGQFILGAEVASFEREFADFLGAQFCIGVANGTDALALALRATGVQPGDEVITVSHSAVATVAAIEQVGAVPVFADIEANTRCLDPACIEPLLSPRTTAVVVVHIYGQPAALDEIIALGKRHGLRIVEDCAQAHGAAYRGRTVGTFGDAAAFSFYPTKNLGALGDGGAVATNSEAVAESVRMLREYGWKERYISAEPGLNSRLDELQAAILRVKLPSLAADNGRRREIAAAYRDAMKGTVIVPPAEIPETTHAMHLFVVETPEREKFREFLRNAGVGTALHYPQAIHQQPAYTGRIRGGTALPVTEKLYSQIVSLPIYPELSEAEVETVCGALRASPSK